MSSLPPLFADLAVILVTAGVITVIFKWLKQPLVLGYIVAGFFIGPYFPWFPAIADDTNIHVWSDIGIVFLMFALGLEFSIKKLRKVGGTGAITALTELCLMFLAGFTVGHILHWSSMECVFLGCMLSISSTTIIIKSFDDLKLKQQRFTTTVTAVLVVEDLVAVLLLVVLGTVGGGGAFHGSELLMSMLRLVFFLVVWFTFGIFLIPTFLRWMRRYMTEETLCIVAVGLCFAMVVIASYAGFSTALGAFVMGAILNETIEADAIHRVITPLKNLFGAIFFVSVGMLVDPHILAHYWLPILLIAATVLLVKPLAATSGILISGKPLQTAVQCGFCFCQIGEFSFIIASLGRSTHAIGDTLYPIIVSVSIITTFLTPYMIKGANPFYHKVLMRVLPQTVQDALSRYSSATVASGDEKGLALFVRKQLFSILLYGVLLAALTLLSVMWLKPFLNNLFATADGHPAFLGNLIGCVVTLVVLSPFLWAMVAKNVNKERIRTMLQEHSHSQGIVVALLLLRYFLALVAVGFVISRYIHLAVSLLIIFTLLAFLLLPLSKRAIMGYRRIEEQFVSNFNQRQAQHSFLIPPLLEKEFVMERMVLTPYSPHAGTSLAQSGLRQNYGVNVVSIERAGVVHDLPPATMQLMPLDRITFLGNEEQLSRLRPTVEVEPDMLIHDHSENEIYIGSFPVDEESPYVHTDIQHSNIQQQWQALVIAVQRGDSYITNPPATQQLLAGDVVWYVSPHAPEQAPIATP